MHSGNIRFSPKSIIMIRDMTEEELLESGRRIGNLLKHYQTVALWNLAGPLANGVLVQTTSAASAAVGDNSAPSDQNSNLFASTSATTESDTAAMSTTAPPESSSGSGSKTGNSSSSSRSCCPSLFWKTTAAAVDPDDNDNDDDDGLVRISRRQRRKRTIHYQQQEQQYNDKQNNNNENKFNNNLIINNNNNNNSSSSSSSSSKKRKSKSIYSRHSMGGVNIGDNDNNNNNNNDRPPALPVLAARDSGAPMLCQQTLFEGESVACFVVGGERRLCFTQLLHSASFRQFSFADISRACAFLHIQCPPTSREQLDTLKLLGILPVSSTSCGLVTKSDATRLHSFLRIQSRASMLAKQRREAERGGIDGMYHHQQQQDQEQLVHGENLKNGGAKPAWLVVEHECFGGCRGRYYVHLYSTPAAECIECCDCGDLLSPETFVSHSHRNYERCVCHWGFDSANWRVYIHLPFDQDDTFYLHLLEQFKGRFEARSRHHDSTTLKRPLTDGTLSEERAKRRRCDAPEKMATFDKCSNLIHQHQQHLHHHQQQQQQQHHHQHHHHLHHHQQQQQLPIIDPALCHAYASMLYAERNLLRAQAVGGPLATAGLAKPEYGGALDLSSASIFPQIPAAPLDLSIRFANNCPLPIVRDCDVQSTSLAKNIQMEKDERMLKSLRMNRPETSDCTGVAGVEQLLNMDAKCMPGPTAQMQAKHPLLNKGLQSTGNESIDALLKKYISDPVGLQEIQSKLFECFKDAEMKMCSLSLQNRVLLQELLQAENRRQLVAQNLLPISTLLTKSFF
ncbi:Ski oncogene [Trichinella nativa]|uniref:Ski oncogene n=1 Tax=Trichinella nativa TaxID=6335 RepID=A0A0V1LBG4_9BILA|nr:Ski oncogene [Trichinella nativa]